MQKYVRRSKRTLSSEINVVPYIDVMLVLLVIFMITAPLLSQGIHVSLPKASSKLLDHKRPPIIVSVDRLGRYFLNISSLPSKPINAQELMSLVSKKLKPKQDVYVKGDRNVNYGKVVYAMSLLKKAGASEVGLITENYQNK